MHEYCRWRVRSPLSKLKKAIYRESWTCCQMLGVTLRHDTVQCVQYVANHVIVSQTIQLKLNTLRWPEILPSRAFEISSFDFCFFN